MFVEPRRLELLTHQRRPVWSGLVGQAVERFLELPRLCALAGHDLFSLVPLLSKLLNDLEELFVAWVSTPLASPTDSFQRVVVRSPAATPHASASSAVLKQIGIALE